MDQIRAPQARAITGGKKSVLVGLLDSGIDANHPDLGGQVDASASVSCVGGVPNASPSAWADIIGHGTHMSGIIAGKKNGVGIVGVAPGVKLAAVKVAVDDLNDPNFGLVFPDAFVCGIDWAIGHDFDLMNASLTIDPFTAPIDDIFCSDQPDRAAIVEDGPPGGAGGQPQEHLAGGGDRQLRPRPRQPRRDDRGDRLQGDPGAAARG